MKKILMITAVFGLVSACTSYDPDLDKEQAKRDANRAANREMYGCTGLDSHEAYRNCLIATHYKNSPKTYTTMRTPDGRSVAVVKTTVKNPNATSTVETERTVITKTVETISRPTVKKITTFEQRPVVTEYIIEEAPVTEVVVVEEAPVVEVAPVVVKEVIVEKTQPVVVKEQTWWETYQDTKEPEVTTTVKCPCEDPNAPCPQCAPK
ncbi:MAG: hypothetical protein LBU87_02795 [Lactobacillales bacterium]|jgi:hypothetical protein|nr:hypothetical protein [Lactobacillales bacterium]